jgi:hypothetical protein
MTHFRVKFTLFRVELFIYFSLKTHTSHKCYHTLRMILTLMSEISTLCVSHYFKHIRNIKFWATGMWEISKIFILKTFYVFLAHKTPNKRTLDSRSGAQQLRLQHLSHIHCWLLYIIFQFTRIVIWTVWIPYKFVRS